MSCNSVHAARIVIKKRRYSSLNVNVNVRDETIKGQASAN